jgi:hypothetical protein
LQKRFAGEKLVALAEDRQLREKDMAAQMAAASQAIADLEQRLKGAEEALRRTTKDYIVGECIPCSRCGVNAGVEWIVPLCEESSVVQCDITRHASHPCPTCCLLPAPMPRAARQQKDAAEAEAVSLREQLAAEQQQAQEQLLQVRQQAAAEIDLLRESLESGSEELVQVCRRALLAAASLSLPSSRTHSTDTVDDP